MSKTQRLVNQLSKKECNALYKSLVEAEAQKTADLLQHYKSNKLDDDEIMEELGVSSGAYYTLRSRLNDKIESHILFAIQSPRTAVLKQVAGVNEILFSKSRTLAISSLKKLEKNLIEYDLSNELTVVYRALKKLMIHDPKYYEYSQLYNKHVAFMVSVDRVEDNLADYFKRFSNYLLNYSDEEDVSFRVIIDEIDAVTRTNDSHRLKVYQSLAVLFHNLCVEKVDLHKSKSIKSIEGQITELELVLDSYKLDTTYHNLTWVVKYLKLLFYYLLDTTHNYIPILLEELDPHKGVLVTNYRLFTFPSFYYSIKLEHYRAEGKLTKLFRKDMHMMRNLDIDSNDVLNFLLYHSYSATVHYYSKRYREGLEVIKDALDEVNLANHPQIYIDVKLLECLLLYKLREKEELSQVINNIKRHIRLGGKESCKYSREMLRIFSSVLSDIDKTKRKNKIIKYVESFNDETRPLHSPIFSFYFTPKDFGVVTTVQLD